MVFSDDVKSALLRSYSVFSIWLKYLSDCLFFFFLFSFCVLELNIWLALLVTSCGILGKDYLDLMTYDLIEWKKYRRWRQRETGEVGVRFEPEVSSVGPGKILDSFPTQASTPICRRLFFENYGKIITTCNTKLSSSWKIMVHLDE